MECGYQATSYGSLTKEVPMQEMWPPCNYKDLKMCWVRFCQCLRKKSSPMPFLCLNSLNLMNMTIVNIGERKHRTPLIIFWLIWGRGYAMRAIEKSYKKKYCCTIWFHTMSVKYLTFFGGSSFTQIGSSSLLDLLGKIGNSGSITYAMSVGLLCVSKKLSVAN